MGSSLPFRFVVVTSYTSEGKGTIVAGTVEQGDVTMGATLVVEANGRASALRGLSGLRQPDGKPMLLALELPELAPEDVAEGDVLVVAS